MLKRFSLTLKAALVLALALAALVGQPRKALATAGGACYNCVYLGDLCASPEQYCAMMCPNWNGTAYCRSTEWCAMEIVCAFDE